MSSPVNGDQSPRILYYDSDEYGGMEDSEDYLVNVSTKFEEKLKGSFQEGLTKKAQKVNTLIINNIRE